MMAAALDTDLQLLGKAIEECGSDDLESIIKKLDDLCLGYYANIKGENTTVGKDVSAPRNLPVDRNEWVELLVKEMMNATSIDDAKTRAAGVLEGLEKSIRASTEAADEEKSLMKKQIEGLIKQNGILKRAVVIQHQRQKESSARNQEVEQLVAQYEEQLRSLEVNNYALRMYLRQGDQQGYPIHDRSNPDVF